MRGRNTALLAKLNWRFNTKVEAPWVKVLRKKYCTHQRLISRNNDKLACSRVWSALKKGKEIFQKGAKWYIGRESKLNFWFDRWADKGPLRSLMQWPLLREEAQLEVKDVISASGWNWSSISMDLPQEVLSEIKATPFVMAASSTDRLAWTGTANGNFNLQSAYELAVDCGGNHLFNGQWIWKIKIFPKIQFFLWRCYHNSIGVNTCPFARGVNISNLCPLCHQAPATIIHALRDCMMVKQIWDHLGRGQSATAFYESELLDWLESNK